MKRLLVIGFIVAMVVGCIGCGASGSDTAVRSEESVSETTSDEVEFSYVDLPDGTITVTSYEASKQPEIIKIPPEIDGKTVVEISGQMFFQENNVKKVILPETVREIDDRTFMNATSIYEIMILGELDRIGLSAFSGCSSLRELDFRNGLKEIDYMAIDLCENLQDVYLPADLESVDEAICILCGDVTIHVPAGSQTETLIREAQEGSDFTGTIVAE